MKFLTHRFIILATMLLLIPLIIFAKNNTFVLAVSSYLNTTGVAVSSIVLLYATISEIRNKQIADMQEHRAQEDHEHVVEMHQLVLDNMRFQHEEMQDLKAILAKMQGHEFKPSELPHEELDLKALHPKGKARFDKGNVHKRLRNQVSSGLNSAVSDDSDGYD